MHLDRVDSGDSPCLNGLRQNMPSQPSLSLFHKKTIPTAFTLLADVVKCVRI